jgi:hypothetical protein
VNNSKEANYQVTDNYDSPAPDLFRGEVSQPIGNISIDSRIGTNIRQEPCGLIVPSTILQAFGDWNCRHLSQRLSPSG